jgi:hypothetical protein
VGAGPERAGEVEESESVEEQSFASDRAIKCSGASVASYSSLVTSEDDRSAYRDNSACTAWKDLIYLMSDMLLHALLGLLVRPPRLCPPPLYFEPPSCPAM